MAQADEGSHIHSQESGQDGKVFLGKYVVDVDAPHTLSDAEVVRPENNSAVDLWNVSDTLAGRFDDAANAQGDSTVLVVCTTPECVNILGVETDGTEIEIEETLRDGSRSLAIHRM